MTAILCAHCLLPVTQESGALESSAPDGKVFCCAACRAIYRMISEEGLQDFYAKRDWSEAGIPEPLRSVMPVGETSGESELPSLLPFIKGSGVVKHSDLLIDGIRCASCVWLIEKIIERTPGIVSARLNFATHRAFITWDPARLSLTRILDRIRSIGYLSRPYTPAAQEEAHQIQKRDLLVRFGTAAFFSMQLMLLSFGLYAGFFQGMDRITKHWLEAGAMLFCTPVLFYAGWPFLRGALNGIRNRVLNMDALISLGALSAYGLSIVQMFSGGEVYFDTAAMIITLVLLGRFFESSAKQKASQAVSCLLSLQPREARVVRGGERLMLSADEIKKGDLIEVRPGEKVPCDGIVRRGSSEIDESLVTGESRAVEKTTGSSVIGGTLNSLGVLLIEVTNIGQDTVISKIALLVERAQAAAAPIQRLADRVSSYFIPLVLGAAGLTFWYWSRYFYADQALLVAVSVLVIACPCALGLATPVAVLAGTGAAARRGIIIKGGDVLERLHQVDVLVLDKTGTITEGRMKVSDEMNAVPRIEGRTAELLQVAASAEQGSEHLTGRAIVQHAKERGIQLLEAMDILAIPGHGICAVVEGMPVRVGKRAFMQKEGIVINDQTAESASHLEQSGRTVVWVARNGMLIGTIALIDAPKRDAREAIDRLHSMKIDVMMITGDNHGTARSVARQIGITTIAANVLPGDKAQEIARLRKAGKVVAMAGDGINDAPALAAADVGMAMASGSDIAIESADVVLMRSDLTGVVQAIEISRRTFQVIRQNLFWAFFYNVAAIPLAMAGFLSPIVAAGAMAMSSVTVVMNSLRLK